MFNPFGPTSSTNTVDPMNDAMLKDLHSHFYRQNAFGAITGIGYLQLGLGILNIIGLLDMLVLFIDLGSL